MRCVGLVLSASCALSVYAAAIPFALAAATAPGAVYSVVVSGRVTRADTGEPMNNVRVEGHQGSVPVFAGYVTETFTDAEGN